MLGHEEHNRQEREHNTLPLLPSASHQILKAVELYLRGNPVSVHYCSQAWSKQLIAEKLSEGIDWSARPCRPSLKEGLSMWRARRNVRQGARSWCFPLFILLARHGSGRMRVIARRVLREAVES
jgi:hypothetical protein